MVSNELVFYFNVTMNLWLIGAGYFDGEDDHILLLDISNNEKYIWTNIYDPTPPTPSVTSSPKIPNPPSSTTENKTNKKLVIICAVMGSIGVISLLLGGFLVYKKRRGGNPRVILTPGGEVISTPGDEQLYENL